MRGCYTADGETNDSRLTGMKGRCFYVRHLGLRCHCTPTEQRINFDILHTNDNRIPEVNSRGAKQRKPNSNIKDRVQALRREESGLVSEVRSGRWRPRSRVPAAETCLAS